MLNKSKCSSISFLLWASIIFQIFSGLGWIALYPYAGYVQLVSILIFIILYINQLGWALLVLSLVLVWSLLPREYGWPNTAQFLSLISFVLLSSLNRGFLSKVHASFAKILCFLCCMSLLFMVLVRFDLLRKGIYIDLDPQFFHLNWPFYLERINISKGIASEFFLFSSRFHGPFFEPGLLGVVIGICLFSNVSVRIKLALCFFGLITFSMAFFAIFIIKILEVSIVKKQFGLILFLGLICMVAYSALPKEGFAYKSTFGRVLQSGDKVLDTRRSVYESEQIRLVNETLNKENFSTFFGLGWDIPGSGGSYRVWLASVGIIGFFVSIFYFLLNAISNLGFLTICFFSRISLLFMLCYLFGNWAAPFFLFIFDKERRV